MNLLNNPYENESIEHIEHLIFSIMLNDFQSCPIVFSKLDVKHFSTPDNKALFKRMKEFYWSKNSMDYSLLISFINNEKDQSIKNVSQFIVYLVNEYTNSHDLDLYIELVLMESTIRELHNFGKNLTEISVDYYNYDDEIWDIQKRFLDIVNSRNISTILNTTEIAKEFSERLENLKQQSNKMTGTTTGFKSINEFTNGFHSGELIILAARPSIGKTTLALNMLIAAAKECESDECVVIFSLEMGAQQLMEKLVSSETNIPSSAFRKGTWNSDDEFYISESIKNIEKLPILIDESSNISILEIQTKLKQIAANKKIKMVVVDYLQLVSGSKALRANRQVEVAQISRTLKSIARDISAPIIAVAQLSRKVEERRGPDKKSKPILSDLRESGSIEQDADIVIFLNYDRDEVDTSNSNSVAKQYSQTVVVDFIIAKNRSGSTGELKLLFEKAYGKYSDYSN